MFHVFMFHVHPPATINAMQDPASYVESLGQRARRAAGELVTLDGAAKVAALRQIPQALRDHRAAIVEANARDLAAALCIKSGNAVILRGGKEAFHSNQAIVNIIHSSLRIEHSALCDAVQLVESTDRALVPLLLKLDRYIDLVIPRGGESLIRAVIKDSTIPVLKHFTGNCHIYVDADVDGMEQQVADIIVNAKTSYPGGAVCNAVEHLLFHESVATK